MELKSHLLNKEQLNVEQDILSLLEERRQLEWDIFILQEEKYRLTQEMVPCDLIKTETEPAFSICIYPVRCNVTYSMIDIYMSV
jgi:hypothetical protein